MNIVYLTLFILLSNDCLAQDEYVARSWPNGNPMVVYFLSTGTSNIEKEQVFYEDGTMDYEGNYLDGVEHGYWSYYWENGNLKSKEFYEFGLEEGTMYDYDKNGNESIKYVYSKGILISKVKLVAP